MRKLAAFVSAGLVFAVAAFGNAATPAPVFARALRLDGASGTEPRVAVGPDGRRWVVTIDGESNDEVVFGSADKGRTWRRTGAEPSGQTAASIDEDIVVTRSGRLVATELDDAGLNLRVAYSDDGGNQWTTSIGPTLADQDRQWLAVGPNHRVYLMWHNLFGGSASHNMFVATSTDDAAHFGPPVPLTLPGSQAYLDLQCADSGGPDGMTVNQQTGVIYAYWGTRSSPAGGCGASATGPFEFNIVAETRAWIATSPDGSAGSWTDHVAVDESASGHIVGMQGWSGALDRKGNFWMVYEYSPHQYPDYGGSPLLVRWAPPDLSKWSAPTVLVPGGGPGNVLAHIVAGDPGKIDVAYFAGVARPGHTPVWYTIVAQTLDALTAHPHVTRVRLSNIPTYTGTASDLMGACVTSGPEPGIQNGLTCGRASDVWGIALDARCLVTVAWPTDKNDTPGSAAATYVSTQTSGPALCSAPAKRR